MFAAGGRGGVSLQARSYSWIKERSLSHHSPLVAAPGEMRPKLTGVLLSRYLDICFISSEFSYCSSPNRRLSSVDNSETTTMSTSSSTYTLAE